MAHSGGGGSGRTNPQMRNAREHFEASSPRDRRRHRRRGRIMRAVGAMRLARVAGYMGGGRLMSAHIPVMRDRVVELMRPAVELAEPLVVHATLCDVGHAEAFLLATRC